VRAPGRADRRPWVAGLAVALALAAVVSFYASSRPDGLERVAEDEGFLDTARDHALADGPLADYGVDGVDDERTSVGLAGVAGVLVTLALGAGIFRLLRRPDRSGDGGGVGTPDPAPVGGVDGVGAATDPTSGDGVAGRTERPGTGRHHTGGAAPDRGGEPTVPRPAGPGG
jgi:cobalt/nickel transport system permease protein